MGYVVFFFFQAEDGIRDGHVTGVQTCALPISRQQRARKQGEVTFLLDRVAEDMADRLAAVMRDFADVADIWTPVDVLHGGVADRFKSVTRFALDAGSETLPLQPQSLDLAVSALGFQFVNDLPGVLA